MPCDGVAVANALIEADKLEIWNAQELMVRADYLGRVLEAGGIEAGQPVASYSSRGEVYFTKGDFTVRVDAFGRVDVFASRGREVEEVRELVTGGIDVFVGAVLQAQAVQAIVGAGVKVENSYTAPNGAMVLTVEL